MSLEKAKLWLEDGRARAQVWRLQKKEEALRQGKKEKEEVLGASRQAANGQAEAVDLPLVGSRLPLTIRSNPI